MERIFHSIFGLSMLVVILNGCATNKNLTAITGQLLGEKGCSGRINDTLLTEIEVCGKDGKYLGKTVEAVGEIYNEKCQPTEQCSEKKYMKNIKSIKIIEE